MKTSHVCSGCKQDKPLSEYYQRKNGYVSRCKHCGNKDSVRWGKENRERHAANSLAWRKANPDTVAEVKKVWRKTHRGNVNASNAHRKAARLRATPAWANMFFVEEVYDLAQLRSMLTGVPHHVDHVVPLRSRHVCGLHVEANLRVIPASVNEAKSNRFWPDMP